MILAGSPASPSCMLATVDERTISPEACSPSRTHLGVDHQSIATSALTKLKSGVSLTRWPVTSPSSWWLCQPFVTGLSFPQLTKSCSTCQPAHIAEAPFIKPALALCPLTRYNLHFALTLREALAFRLLDDTPASSLYEPVVRYIFSNTASSPRRPQELLQLLPIRVTILLLQTSRSLPRRHTTSS